MNHAVAEAQPVSIHPFDFTIAGFGFADNDIDVMFFKTLETAGDPRGAHVGRPICRRCAHAGNPSGARRRSLSGKAFAPAHNRAQDHHVFAAVGAPDPVKNLAARQVSGVSAGRIARSVVCRLSSRAGAGSDRSP